MSMKRLIDKLKKQGRVIQRASERHIDFPATWRLPFPPSTNKLWSSVMIDGHPRRVLTEDARLYKKRVRAIVRGAVPAGVLFELEITVCAVLFNKDKSPKIIDLTNRVKLIEDAIAEGLGYNDCRNWRVVLQKRHVHEPRQLIVRLGVWTGK